MLVMLDDLLPMLRQAPEGTRELDQYIAEHFGWRWRAPIGGGPRIFVDPSGVEVEAGWPRYTTDPAIAVQMWPHGWIRSLVCAERDDGTPMWAVTAWRTEGDEVRPAEIHPHETMAASAALAQCIGALMATRIRRHEKAVAAGQVEAPPKTGAVRLQSGAGRTRVEIWTGQEWRPVPGVQRVTWTAGMDGPPRMLVEVDAHHVDADLLAAAGSAFVRAHGPQQAQGAG